MPANPFLVVIAGARGLYLLSISPNLDEVITGTMHIRTINTILLDEISDTPTLTIFFPAVIFVLA
jgi:hypothetical protein